MYSVLDFRDPAWAASMPQEIAAFADEHRVELRDSTRSGRFPRKLYAERAGAAGSDRSSRSSSAASVAVRRSTAS